MRELRDLARKGCTGEEVDEGGTKDVGEVERLMFKGILKAARLINAKVLQGVTNPENDQVPLA